MRSSTPLLSIAEMFALLALLLLAVAAAPKAFAQQSAEVKSDPQLNVEAPNRSVDAVDRDPEKAKEDADAAHLKKAQKPYSTWGIQRNSGQNTPLDEAAVANQPSTWTLQSKPVSTTTANNDIQPQDAERLSKRATPRIVKTRSATPKYGLATGSKRQIGVEPFGIYGGSGVATSEPGSFNPSAALAFDPMRNFSGLGAMAQGEFGATPRERYGPRMSRLSRSHAEYCHAAVMSGELKRLCAQSQKKGEQTTNSARQSSLRDSLSKTKF